MAETSAFQPAAEAYVSLATFRRDGREVRTPVWIAGDASGRCYVVSAGDAGKVKRIRATERVRVAPCDVRARLLAETWRDGRGTILTGDESCAAAHGALVAKYGWQMHLLDLSARLGRRYHRRAYLALDFD